MKNISQLFITGRIVFTQLKRKKELYSTKIQKACISVGFNSWKKAPKSFEEHQMSGCHKAAVNMKAVAVLSPDIDKRIQMCALFG